MNRCLALGSFSEMLLRHFECGDFLPAMGVQIKRPVLLLDTNVKKKKKSVAAFYVQGH